jgi:hypothetical protein
MHPDACDTDIIEKSKLILPEGKYMGKTIHEIAEIDMDYVVFLSGNYLNFKQQLKYKKFFERIPVIVLEAKRLTDKMSTPKQETQGTIPGKNVAACGGWRGW